MAEAYLLYCGGIILSFSQGSSILHVGGLFTVLRRLILSFSQGSLILHGGGLFTVLRRLILSFSQGSSILHGGGSWCPEYSTHMVPNGDDFLVRFWKDKNINKLRTNPNFTCRTI